MLIITRIRDNKVEFEEVAIIDKNKSIIMDELEERTINGLTRDETNLVMSWYSKTSSVLMFEKMPVGEDVLHREYHKPTGTNKYFALCYYDKNDAHSIIPVKNPRLLRELRSIESKGKKEEEEHKARIEDQIRAAENYLKVGKSEKLKKYFESYIIDSKKYLNN